MKHILLFVFSAMLMGGCDHSHNAAVAVDANGQSFYGTKFETTGSIPVSSLATAMEGKDSLDTVIEGVIDQTCPNAGCWMNMRLDNGQLLKVTTDHVFFVPLEGCAGLKSMAKGKAFAEEISVEQQKHYAMEEGKTEAEIAAITEPKKIMSFVATGIMIDGYKAPEGGEKQGSCTHDEGSKEHEEHSHEGHEEVTKH